MKRKRETGLPSSDPEYYILCISGTSREPGLIFLSIREERETEMERTDVIKKTQKRKKRKEKKRKKGEEKKAMLGHSHQFHSSRCCLHVSDIHYTTYTILHILYYTYIY